MSVVSPLPPIIDGHNDTLLRLQRSRGQAGSQFHVRTNAGHLDLPRMREGGMAGGFFAMYAPSPARAASSESLSVSTGLGEELDHAYALEYALRLFALLRKLDKELHSDFRMVCDSNQLQTALEEGVCFAIPHIEDAVPIDAELELLPLFYDLGLRSLGLVWSRPNVFGCGVPFDFPSSPDTGPGLSSQGKALVKACNELSILVDLSHLNEKGFWDVANLTEAPLVATHSNAHAMCNASRNLTDKQLDAIQATNGVVGLNYNVGFLREDGRPEAPTSSSEIVRHAIYMVEQIGIEHVALGSDFDGAVMPYDLASVSQLPDLMGKFRSAGFSDRELKQIAYLNWVRVLSDTWK